LRSAYGEEGEEEEDEYGRSRRGSPSPYEADSPEEEEEGGAVVSALFG
jgi:hypothetical protein